MDRQFTGYFTVGGRGANRNFHGKVASMVVTTLKQDDNMPSDAEIQEMITDPVGWLQDYKDGNTARFSESMTNFVFRSNPSHSDNIYASYATQVWLMGDGVNDSYSNMIRNYVRPSDQNYSKLNLISMVSNDIQSVTINGLS